MYERVFAGDATTPPEGPAGWSGWGPWDKSPACLLCPSDSPQPAYGGGTTRVNNYAFSVGDQVISVRDDQTVRGLFGYARCYRFGEVLDGLMADGSVHFISETIDTGNLGVQQPNDGRSRYGVWGALGSKAGGETVSGF
jgi:hypothetical protein